MIKWSGTAFRFHPLFIIMMLLAIFTGYFFEIITLFSIVLIHELGHVTAAKGLGWKVTEIQLLPFGGVAVVEGAVPAVEEIIVALAGPMQNALMIGFAFLMEMFGFGSTEWWNYFIQTNLFIGLFNLLPITPLDGGRVMQALMSFWTTYHKTLVYSIASSMFLSAVIVIISFAHFHASGLQLNLLMIGLFLLYSNWYSYRSIPYLFLIFLMSREARMQSLIDSGTLAQPIVVQGKRTVGQIVQLFMREKYHLIYVINDRGKIQNVLPEQRLLNKYFVDKGSNSAVSDLFMLK